MRQEIPRQLKKDHGRSLCICEFLLLLLLVVVVVVVVLIDRHGLKGFCSFDILCVV